MLLAVCGWCSTFHIVTSLGKEILFRILSLDMESCSAAFLPRIQNLVLCWEQRRFFAMKQKAPAPFTLQPYPQEFPA